jgi:hypothetical protein
MAMHWIWCTRVFPSWWHVIFMNLSIRPSAHLLHWFETDSEGGSSILNALSATDVEGDKVEITYQREGR